MFNTFTVASNNVIICTDNTTGNITGGLPYGTTVGIDPTLITGSYTYGATTTVPSVVIPTNKRCRDCNHAHLNDQCVEFSDWGAVTFVKCHCKEYLSKDNLEYLEQLYEKRQRSKDSPRI